MRAPLPLFFLVLPLLAAPAPAQTAPALAASAPSADTPTMRQLRHDLLAKIDPALRDPLLAHTVPPDLMAEELRARLKAIREAAIKAARTDDLLWLQEKFEEWNDLFHIKFIPLKNQGLTRVRPDERMQAQIKNFTIHKTAVEARLQLSREKRDFDDGTAAFAAAPVMGASAREGIAASNKAAAFSQLHLFSSLPFNEAVPPPPVTSQPLSYASLLSYIDQSRGYRIAEAVFQRATGFAHHCYAAVKTGLIAARDTLWANINNSKESGKIGLPPGLAADYQRAVNANPILLAKLGYRRVDICSIPGVCPKDSKGNIDRGVPIDPNVLPSGTLFDFGPGCARYDAKAGHIEIIGKRDMLKDIPPRARPALGPYDALACSDGCHGRTVSYYRDYGTGPRSCMSMYFPVRG